MNGDIVWEMEKNTRKKTKSEDMVMQPTKKIVKGERNSKNAILKEKGKKKRGRSQLRF